MSQRPDILTPIHKGLELLMFQTATLLGRTDFALDAEATRADQEVRRCLGLQPFPGAGAVALA